MGCGDASGFWNSKGASLSQTWTGNWKRSWRRTFRHLQLGAGRLQQIERKEIRPERTGIHENVQKEYRDELISDSVGSFEKKCLQKSSNPKDVIILSETYDGYVAFCKREEKPDIQSKNDFKKRLRTWAI